MSSPGQRTALAETERSLPIAYDSAIASKYETTAG